MMIMAIAATTFNKAIVVLDFHLNKNYISTTLCVNRTMTKSCCKGKCFLKKQLQKEEDQGKNGAPASKDKSEVSLFCETMAKNNFHTPVIDKLFSDKYLLKKYSTISSPVFRPPGKAC